MKFSAHLALAGAILFAASCGEAGDISDEPIESVVSALTAGNMNGNEYLFQGQRLNAKSCYYNLRMQSDGNLVVYAGQGSNAIWATHTTGTSPSLTAYAAMQGDGNLVVRSNTGHVLWSSNTYSSHNARLAMQNDGNLVIYRSSNDPINPGKAVWASHTEGEALGTDCLNVKPTEVTQVLGGVDRPGSDLPGMPITTFPYHSQCGNACAKNPSCKAYTWVGDLQDCWLKSAVPPAVFSSGMTSGVKVSL